MGRPEEAIASYREMESRPLPGTIRDLMRACRLVLEGHKEESQKIAQTFFDKHFDPEGLYFTARVLARVDEPEASLDLLDRIIEKGFYCSSVMMRDPWMDSIRGRSRFAEVVRRAEARTREAAERVPPAQWRSTARPQCLTCEIFRSTAKDFAVERIRLRSITRSSSSHFPGADRGAVFAVRKPHLMRLGILAAAIFAWFTSLVAVTAGQRLPAALLRNHPAISYERAPVTNAISQLNARLRAGEVTLESKGPSGYLESLLKVLHVPVESQVLVFSKTSFQAPRINPRNPRAIFFNDTVSVGWVRGGPVLEVMAQDPKQGAIFYTLEQAQSGVPQFERNDTCASCHTSDATQNVPGPFVGSVFPGVDGITMYGPAYTTDHRSPFELRWGGWYVTGTHKAARHMGNAVATDPSDLAAMVTPATVHVTNLEGRFDMTGYLSPHSDIVALLVLEHQAQMLNLITRVGWEARTGAADAGGRSTRRPRSSWTTCCSSMRRRCPGRWRERHRSRRGSTPRRGATAAAARCAISI